MPGYLKGQKGYIEKAEEAAGITEAEPEMPYKKGEYLKPGEVARQWTGPKPWKDLGDKGKSFEPQAKSPAKPL